MGKVLGIVELSFFPESNISSPPQAILVFFYPQIRGAIRRGSAVKRALAAFFLAVGTAHVRALRVVKGVALRYAVQARPAWKLMQALLVAAVTYPFYR